MLTYMVTLILRHDQNNVGIWMNEWFPKEGYGYFLAFIYVVLHIYQRGAHDELHIISEISEAGIFLKEV